MHLGVVFAFATIIAAQSCAPEPEPEPDMEIRSSATQGAVSRYELELRGEPRHVASIDLGAGERAAIVQGPDGELLAAGRTADDDAIEYDIEASVASGSPLECASPSCSTVDPISEELLTIALAGELPAAAPNESDFRMRGYFACADACGGDAPCESACGVLFCGTAFGSGCF